jgi:DNA-binding response OmpR family regulator
MSVVHALSYSIGDDVGQGHEVAARGPVWPAVAREPAQSPSPAARPARQYVVGPLEVDLDRHRVVVTGRRVHVSAMQMRLLVYLIEHQDRVVSRSELLQDVWGYKPTVLTRTVDIHVQRLRGKLGTAAFLIGTVRGVGYRLSVERD